MSYYNGSSYTFTWKDGRRLATLTKGNTSVSYKYNSDGIRYEKTVNGVVHKYYLMGSAITAETIIDGTNTTHIEYFYDSYGPYGFSIDGTFYYYIKNLQGDVTQIRDENKNLIASYVYDAWGKVLSVTENTVYNVGATNAIRYRGYYYDTESNLYYLNARYYDPQIKRFLSPDAILGANGGLVGYNMYAYCNNNPIISYDPLGARLYNIVTGEFEFVRSAYSIFKAANKVYNTSNDIIETAEDIYTIIATLKNKQQVELFMTMDVILCYKYSNYVPDSSYLSSRIQSEYRIACEKAVDDLKAYSIIDSKTAFIINKSIFTIDELRYIWSETHISKRMINIRIKNIVVPYAKALIDIYIKYGSSIIGGIE